MKKLKLGIVLGSIILLGLSGYIGYSYWEEGNSPETYERLLKDIDRQAEDMMTSVEPSEKKENLALIKAYYPRVEEGKRHPILEKTLSSVMEETQYPENSITVYQYDKVELDTVTLYRLHKHIYTKEFFGHAKTTSDVIATHYESKKDGFLSLSSILEDPFVDTHAVLMNLQAAVKHSESDESVKRYLLEQLTEQNVDNVIFVYTDQQFSLLGKSEQGHWERVTISPENIVPYVKGTLIYDAYQEVYQQNNEHVQMNRTALRSERIKLLTETISKKVPSKKIALTFDDGPNVSSTTRALDILKEHDVKATFFVLGQLVSGNEEILKRQIQEGHEIGNHTFTHPDLTSITPEQVVSEIAETQKAIEKAVGILPKIVRPPYGAINEVVMEAIPYPIIMWNIDSLDWAVRDGKTVSDFVTQHTHDGSIILMHDIHETSIDALPEMIPALKAAGFEFVTVSQLYPPKEMSRGLMYFTENDARIIGQE